MQTAGTRADENSQLNSQLEREGLGEHRASASPDDIAVSAGPRRDDDVDKAIDTIIEACNAVFEANGTCLISHLSSFIVWLLKNGAFAICLAEFAQEPFKFDPRKHEEVIEYLGTGRKGQEEADTKTHAKLHLRSIRAQASRHAKWSSKTCLQYPFEMREKPVRNELERFDANETVFRHYAGTTIVKADDERYDDEHLGYDPSKRYRHFVEASQQEERVEHYLFRHDGDEWLVDANEERATFKIRAHDLSMDGERILVALLGAASLNSVEGGFYVQYRPSKRAIEMRAKINQYEQLLQSMSVDEALARLSIQEK